MPSKSKKFVHRATPVHEIFQVQQASRRRDQRRQFWFYERTRGQYIVEGTRLTGAKKRQFELENPKDQLINKTDLAKVLNSWEGLPHEVSKGAQKNFTKFAESVSKEWDKDPARFNDEYFRQAVAKMIIFKALEKLVPKEPWYSGGYRANIVTYSVAKLAHMTEQRSDGKRINLDSIWRSQVLPHALELQLRLIAETAYRVLTEPEAGIQNVTEWAKKELAWTRMREVKVGWVAAQETVLVSASETQARVVAARKDAKVDAAVNALEDVLHYGAASWTKLRELGNAAGLLTSSDEQLLRVAVNPRWVPTDKQAKELLKLKARLAQEGVQIAT